MVGISLGYCRDLGGFPAPKSLVVAVEVLGAAAPRLSSSDGTVESHFLFSPEARLPQLSSYKLQH
jgi:hypothetical protein